MFPALKGVRSIEVSGPDASELMDATPGDLLYVPAETQKVYKIIRVTDGRPKIAQLFGEDYRGESQRHQVMTKW